MEGYRLNNNHGVKGADDFKGDSPGEEIENHDDPTGSRWKSLGEGVSNIIWTTWYA